MREMQQEAENTDLRLKKDFSWILAGNLYYAATQYILLIAITRLTPPETLGRFSLALAINAPISLFFSLGLRAVLISDAKNEFTSSAYLGLRALTSMLSISVAVAIALGNDFTSKISLPILIIAFVKAAEAIADLLYGFFQKQGQNHRIAISMAIRGSFSCLLSVLILLRSGDLTQVCLALLVSSVLVLVFYDCFNLRGIFLRLNLDSSTKRSMKLLALVSLPLGCAAVLSSLELNVPRYLIEHRIGLVSLGIFSALSYPLMLGNQIVGALASASSPRLAELFQHGHLHSFKALLTKLAVSGIAVGFLTSLACFIFGKPILSLLKHPEYTNDSAAFGILGLAAGMNYVAVFFGAGLSAMKCFRAKLLLQLFSFAAVVFFSIFASSQKTVYSMSIAILLGSFLSLASQFLVYFLKMRILSDVDLEQNA